MTIHNYSAILTRNAIIALNLLSVLLLIMIQTSSTYFRYVSVSMPLGEFREPLHLLLAPVRCLPWRPFAAFHTGPHSQIEYTLRTIFTKPRDVQQQLLIHNKRTHRAAHHRGGVLEQVLDRITMFYNTHGIYFRIIC